MNRRFKIAIALLLLIVVAAVLISPAVDLEPTALRASLWSAALFASLAAVTIALSGFRLAFVSERVTLRLLRRAPHSIPLIDLDCVRLC